MQRRIQRISGNLLDADLHQLPILNLAAGVQVVRILLTGTSQHKRLRAVQLLRAGVQGDLVAGDDINQLHVDGHVSRHAAKLIDEFLELHEVHIHVVLRGDAGELGNFLLKLFDAADVIHLVELHLLAVVLGARIARNRDQGYLVGFRVHAHQHQHVAAPGAVEVLRFRDLDCARTRVVADHHNVERLGFSLRSLHAVRNLKGLILVSRLAGLLLAAGQHAQRKHAARGDRQNPLPYLHFPSFLTITPYGIIAVESTSMSLGFPPPSTTLMIALQPSGFS